MRLTTALFAALALTACEEVAGPVLEPSFDPAVGPTVDLNMTQGYTEADHTEVAPGVFLLTDLYEAGEVNYVPEMEMGQSLPDEREPYGFGPGGSSYCYEYDTQSYYDSTSQASLFGGDVTWYGYAYAYSYDYSYPAYSYDADMVSTYVYTYAPREVDYVYAYSYVYVNDRYVGYVSSSTGGGQYAYASGSWTVPCTTGSIDLMAYTSHYVYDTVGVGTSAISQSLSLGNTLQASVTCCP